MAAKIFVFVMSRDFCEIFNFVFREIFNFTKHEIILSQFRVLQNFDNAVSQPSYVGVE